MTTKTIPQLPSGSALAGTEPFESVQGGNSVQITAQQIADFAGGSGDVVGPGSATDNALVRFDGTTGKLVQNSAATLDDSGGLHLAGNGATNYLGYPTTLSVVTDDDTGWAAYFGNATAGTAGAGVGITVANDGTSVLYVGDAVSSYNYCIYALPSGVQYFGSELSDKPTVLVSPVFFGQAAPTAKTGDATLTAPELLNGIATVTSSSAVAITLPTGTAMQTGSGGVDLSSDNGFDWSVINLGSASGAVTMTVNTNHTYVGNATVAINTSARFRTRKTAANTFVTYRIA